MGAMHLPGLRCGLKKGDRVITPRDEAGVVDLVTPGGFVHGEYFGALSADDAFFTLHESLLVHWPRGQRRPAPVRRGA